MVRHKHQERAIAVLLTPQPLDCAVPHVRMGAGLSYQIRSKREHQPL
jgi:hypothetical protein